jgi:hypothetical protein
MSSEAQTKVINHSRKKAAEDDDDETSSASAKLAKTMMSISKMMKSLEKDNRRLKKSVSALQKFNVERRGGNSRLGVSLETHVKIWYQKLKLKLSYE